MLLHSIWHFFAGILSDMKNPTVVSDLGGPCIVQMGVFVLSRHGHMWRCECSLVLPLGGSSLNSGEIPYYFGRFPKVFCGSFTN